MRIIDGHNTRALARLLARDHAGDRRFERRVASIVERVRTAGDHALLGFARRFDGVTPPLEVAPETMRREAARVPPHVRAAIRQAVAHIAAVASRQVPKRFVARIDAGVVVEQRVEPLARVGCYVPGGRFPLPSSLLMTAVPARIAGVSDIIAVCPRPEPSVMAAALEAGVTRLFRVGGAHAIAALAYGTASIPKVDKIVGPGNRYVATAKACVSGDCAIDFYAGPTEIVIVAAQGRADWIAADLVAQAEHDPDARAVFLTWSRALAGRVAEQVARQAAGQHVVARSIARRGAIVVVSSPAQAMDIANRMAPEHLVVDREDRLARGVTAGTVFVGPYSAQAAGDYATGSNHVLPTAGAARFRGGLSAADYVRTISIQRLTREGLSRLAPTVLALAGAEGLRAHARSVEVRLR